MVRHIFLSIIILFVLSSVISCNLQKTSADYGEITTFSKDKSIRFPDFELTYIGERKQTSTFPNGNTFTFTYYDFKLKNDKEEKTISWSAGAGEIGPANFEFTGKKFMLALMYWEKEKKYLDEDELIIMMQ